mmetsp:Transcript_15738/g.19730  ORF Transcript_15738/g.19730 Transcript_15738/m.19730 type:complete len:84 (-) Transcript_15738:265-516(-)
MMFGKKKKNTIGPEKPGPIRANKGQCEKKNSQVQKSVPKGWKCNQMIEKNFFQVGKCSKMKKKWHDGKSLVLKKKKKNSKIFK